MLDFRLVDDVDNRLDDFDVSIPRERSLVPADF